MIDMIVQYGGAVICAGVLIGCICRVDQMRIGKTKAVWWLVYVLFAVYALGVGLDLVQGRYVDWYEAGGVGGVLLEFLLTIKSWRNGPPRAVQTGPAPLGEE